MLYGQAPLGFKGKDKSNKEKSQRVNYIIAIDNAGVILMHECLAFVDLNSFKIVIVNTFIYVTCTQIA